jgi:hypothetical protein
VQALTPVYLSDVMDAYQATLSTNITLALMQTNCNQHWPCNKIPNIFYQINRNIGINKSFKNNPDNYQYLISRPEVLADLPDANPLEFVTRSGMLTNEVLRKEAMHFDLWEDLVFLASNEDPAVKDTNLQLQILSSLADVYDPGLQRSVMRGLLSISADSFEDRLPTDRLLEVFQNIFPCMPVVTKSHILKLNVFVTGEYPNALDLMQMAADNFSDILNNQNTLISRIAGELMWFNPNELGYAQLTVGNKLAAIPLPPQVLNFSPEWLVLHVIEGLYGMGAHPECEQGVVALVNVLAQHHSFNYDAFLSLESDAKALLVRAGLDIQKLPGLSIEHRCRLLEEALGL